MRRKVLRKKDSGTVAEEDKTSVNTPGPVVVVKGSVLPEKKLDWFNQNLCCIKSNVYECVWDYVMAV